ncbi:hypothetical protein GW17_00026871 [Ensete ventricosum]|nr:hypothetical protein GW17_00026871 [Ensete ventricosum]
MYGELVICKFYKIDYFSDYRSSSGGAVILDDCNFHESVRLDSFDVDRTLTLVRIPPDGEFAVMNYRMTQEFKPPFRVNALIEEAGQLKAEVIIKKGKAIGALTAFLSGWMRQRVKKGRDGRHSGTFNAIGEGWWVIDDLDRGSHSLAHRFRETSSSGEREREREE